MPICGPRHGARTATNRRLLRLREFGTILYTRLVHLGGLRPSVSPLALDRASPSPSPLWMKNLRLTLQGSRRSPATFSMIRVGVLEVTDAHISTCMSVSIVEDSTPDVAALASSPSNLPFTLRPLLFAPYLHCHPNQQYVQTLLSHMTWSFDIGNPGPHWDVCTPSLASTFEHQHVIDTYLAIECSAG